MRMGLRLLAVLTILSGTIGVAAGRQTGNQVAAGGQTPQLTLTSPAFKDMEPLPLKFTQTANGPFGGAARGRGWRRR